MCRGLSTQDYCIGNKQNRKNTVAFQSSIRIEWCTFNCELNEDEIMGCCEFIDRDIPDSYVLCDKANLHHAT